MRNSKSSITLIIACCFMLIVILDSKTAITGAYEGIDICIHTVIPSLFPLIFLSIMIRESICKQDIKFLRTIGKLFRIPKGTETIMFLGLLGGYPIGARCLQDAYVTGQIGKANAERLLPLCNTAGPAFIFGVVASMFPHPASGWVIWLIQILSVLCTSYILPNCIDNNSEYITPKYKHSNDLLLPAVKSIATICGWVVLFRVLLKLMDRWIFWLLPAQVNLVLSGLLELTNGIYLLTKYDCPTFLFICVNCFLSFGGVCVFLQVKSSASMLRQRVYILGKLVQTAISGLSASIILLFFAYDSINYICMLVFLTVSIIFFILARKYSKNNTGNHALCSV